MFTVLILERYFFYWGISMKVGSSWVIAEFYPVQRWKQSCMQQGGADSASRSPRFLSGIWTEVGSVWSMTCDCEMALLVWVRPECGLQEATPAPRDLQMFCLYTIMPKVVFPI